MFKKLLLLFVLVLPLILGTVLVAFGQQEDAVVATEVSQDNVSLTLYPDGTTVVRDVRTFEVTDGLNWVPFRQFMGSSELESIAFASLSGTAQLIRREYQQPSDAVVNISTLLSQNIGQQVSVTLQDGTAYTGLLQGVEYGILLQLEDNSFITVDVSQIQRYQLTHVEIPEATEPTLMLLIDSSEAGQQQFSISYITSGLGWLTNYNVIVGEDNESLTITGWLSIYNYSSGSYEDAQVRLVSGDTSQVQFASVQEDFAALPTATAAAMPDAMGGGGGGGGSVSYPDDFTYVVPQRLDLLPGDSKALEFLAGVQIQVQNVYIFDASPRILGYSGFITSQNYGLTEITAVQNYLEFATLQQDGTAIALPPGEMRVYKEDEGSLLILGQAQLPYTPAGETVQIYLENSDDVTGERRQTEFQQLSADVIQESFEIRLRNRGEESLTVVVPERMSRSAIWEILGSSTPYEQPDPFGIEFTVEVPAGGETIITYTVLYTRQ